MARLLPAGTHARDIFDGLGIGCWHYKVNRIPYVLAYADLVVDPTRRTSLMKTTRSAPGKLVSLAGNALSNRGAEQAADFVTAILADPGLQMTLDQLVFPSCSVAVLPLSRFETGYGEMSLVTSEGPYQGWIIGTHCLNSSVFWSGFPTFTQYRTFRDSFYLYNYQ